jgi:hypothetical protein
MLSWWSTYRGAPAEILAGESSLARRAWCGVVDGSKWGGLGSTS